MKDIKLKYKEFDFVYLTHQARQAANIKTVRAFQIIRIETTSPTPYVIRIRGDLVKHIAETDIACTDRYQPWTAQHTPVTPTKPDYSFLNRLGVIQ